MGHDRQLGLCAGAAQGGLELNERRRRDERIGIGRNSMEVKLTAASYRWRCPECGQEHFVGCVRSCVSCPDCGCICKVVGAEHRSQADDDKGRSRAPTQAHLF